MLHTSGMDVQHPQYNRWLTERKVRECSTGSLLRALVSRHDRQALHLGWRSERCNPVVAYTYALDEIMVDAISDHLAERIDSGRTK